jgi:AcrR family transcriptional regulator
MSSKRDQILIATRDLVIERGLQDISMSQIAGRAGVGMGTIYNYFTSKEELVYVLYSEIKAEMSAYVLDDYDEKQPLVVRFMRLLSNVAHYGVQHPREFRFTELLATVPFIQDQYAANDYPITLLTNALFVEAQNQHLLKALPAPVIALIISGALYALIEAHAEGQIQLDDALIQQSVSACWDAIKR